MHANQLLTRPLLAVSCAAGLLAGCNSPPVPREQLAVGRSSVEAAQSAGAGELAPVELNQARDKLNRANMAMQDKRFNEARVLAEQADVDAQVARTKANAERSRRAAEEVMASVRSLRQQMGQQGQGTTTQDQNLMPQAPAAGNVDQTGGQGQRSPSSPSPMPSQGR